MFLMGGGVFLSVLAAIAVITIVFVIRRRRNRAAMTKPVVRDFDAFRDDEFDEDF